MFENFILQDCSSEENKNLATCFKDIQPPKRWPMKVAKSLMDVLVDWGLFGSTWFIWFQPFPEENFDRIASSRRGLLGWSLWDDFGSHLHCLNTLSRLEWNDVSSGFAGHEPCQWWVWKALDHWSFSMTLQVFIIVISVFQAIPSMTWFYVIILWHVFLRVSIIMIYGIIYKQYAAHMPHMYCAVRNSHIWGLNPCISFWTPPGSAPCFMAQNMNDSRWKQRWPLGSMGEVAQDADVS